ncbi:hypothetical protein F4802DRAFT_326926 [Xylaria palmicola]|nr:hypothetical protein F4802DRAFT_326926 [Xylaria palmicola]
MYRVRHAQRKTRAAGCPSRRLLALFLRLGLFALRVCAAQRLSCHSYHLTHGRPKRPGGLRVSSLDSPVNAALLGHASAIQVRTRYPYLRTHRRPEKSHDAA